jgi:hypothetical protein
MKNYIEFQDYINMLAADFKDSGLEYGEEYAMECAGSSEYVIYYGKAWELVTLVRDSNYDLYSEGEEYSSDCRSESTDLDRQMVSVAYWIIYTAVLEAVVRNALTAKG